MSALGRIFTGFPHYLRASLIESEIPCGTGMCRPKSNNLAVA